MEYVSGVWVMVRRPAPYTKNNDSGPVYREHMYRLLWINKKLIKSVRYLLNQNITKVKIVKFIHEIGI